MEPERWRSVRAELEALLELPAAERAAALAALSSEARELAAPLVGPDADDARLDAVPAALRRRLEDRG